jgi:hypothetical protein
MQFHSDLGRQTQTAHTTAVQHAAAVAIELSPQASATAVGDCSIGGNPAAVFGFRDRSDFGYFIYVVHNSYLFHFELWGASGIGDAAIADAKGMLGSIAWGPWKVPGDAP